VTLEVFNAAGELVRRYASDDQPEPPLEGQNVPDYWPRPPQVLSAEAGLHRFVWDLQYPRPAVFRFSYPISAIPYNTPVTPAGPWVLPGTYTVRLTVDGQALRQQLVVKMDPRVTTPEGELVRQHRLSMKLYRLLRLDFDTLAEVEAFRADAANAAKDAEAAVIEGTLRGLNGALGSLFRIVEGADIGPTSQTMAAAADAERELWSALEKWEALRLR
jgi:hypothetical protein